MTTQTIAGPTLRTHLFKACQRCHGDLVLDREEDFEKLGAASDYVCLQCGRRTPVDVVIAALMPVVTASPVAARAA